MTKKIVSLFLALALLAAVPAFAEPTEIDGISDRNIKINRAGLNPSADDVIGEGCSPTTGRALDEIEAPDGFLGVSVTGQYLSGKKVIPVPKTRRKPTGWLKIHGAAMNNLKHIDVDVPLGVPAGGDLRYRNQKRRQKLYCRYA